MNAYLIDPFARTVTAVDYSGDFNDIYKLIDCDTFDVARVGKGEDIFVDDNGLFAPPDNQQFFVFESYPQPLAGKGLLLGTDGRGETIASSLTIEEVKSRLSWVNVLIPAEDGMIVMDEPCK